MSCIIDELFAELFLNRNAMDPVADLSGPQNKAPGFAGEYLLEIP